MEEGSPSTTQEPAVPTPPDQPGTEPAPPAPVKKGPSKMLIIGVVVVVIVLIAAIAGFALLGGSDAANTNVKSTPQEMALKLSDFPESWHAGSTASITNPQWNNTGYYVSVFNNTVEGGGPFDPSAEVVCQLVTYQSVAEAQRVYGEMKENVTGMNQTKVTDHFDQCMLYTLELGEMINSKMYVFQERNVCGIILFSSFFGYNMTQEWIDHMLEVQEARIV
jgi:hypothetical protein